MAFDEGLAERIRDVLVDEAWVAEKKMFGGLAFMYQGHMFVGIVGESLMVRVGPVEYKNDLQRPHVREMDFTGKPMKGYVFVDPAGHERDEDLAQWVEKARFFVSHLPPK